MPCYNRANELRRVLDAYENQRLEQPFEVIAVDDASSDDTLEVLTSYQPTRYALHVEHLEENQGPAAARNRGISLAKAPVIMFVGDDILPRSDLLRGHLAAHRRNPENEIAILGKVVWPNDFPVNTLMRHIDGVGSQQFSYHFLIDGEQYDFRHLYTANISLKRSMLFSQDTWFDTGFQFAALEDAELGYRLSRDGLRIIYASNLIGYHYHYHNVWTFTTRQYRVGLMATKFIEKYPEVRTSIVGRKWPYQLYYWRLLSALGKYSPGSTDWLESECLHLLSEYEWREHALLDHLYLQILRYYFYKGLIYGALGESDETQKVRSLYADRVLVPLLSWFIQESERISEPLPDLHGPWMKNRLEMFRVVDGN
jgi:glycosyltransferase involved in cell wall biosynthesis